MLTRALAVTRLTSAKAFPAGTSDDDKASMLGEALERLINSGRYKGTRQNAAFRLNSSGELTLPRQYASLQGVRIGGTTQQIAGAWYEYLPGYSEGQGTPSAFQDRGDGFCTFADISPLVPQKLKVTCTTPGSGTVVNIQGRDENGRNVYQSTGEKGELLTVGDAPTSQLWSAVTAVVKEPTDAPLTLTAVDPTSDEETELGVYEPGETVPSYKRYWLLGARDLTEDQLDDLPVVGMCQLRYVEAAEDNDVLFTENFGAIKNAVRSIHFENIGEGDLSEEAFAKAIKLLNDELKRSRAPSEAGAIRIVALGGFGASGMPRQSW